MKNLTKVYKEVIYNSATVGFVSGLICSYKLLFDLNLFIGGIAIVFVATYLA